ncbi:pulmonary surfactant-associated protein A-like isoform X2 [Xenia sp. Carnegie-2017]|uniref:pulmonary surfactant-associated protein A-like isoform X2 n=1 Tax=Xenia sp. Carnegie-2017 TaxID=2897299 RepID=UPI001F049AF9|nr:pulmonary surfactant-associated protein A-like isoform X2 [Xenia sp. Carnegie-2017]
MFKLLFLLCIVVNNFQVNEASRCPSGWTYLRQSCYYFSTTKTKGSKAILECQRMGGYLALPKNLVENNAIYSVAKRKNLQRPFIGLFRNKYNKQFYTMQHALPAFINWSPKEPNNVGNKENCVQFFPKGKWNDESCYRSYHYICQRNPCDF